MTNRKVQNLTPFVPAKDFDLSSRFYRDLGFAAGASITNAVRFERDGYGFRLQDYYVEDWAGNFMFCLYVQESKRGGLTSRPCTSTKSTAVPPAGWRNHMIRRAA